MSNSTDSLKKKVCVTVFLDELFEEVAEEDWTDAKQVSEVSEREAKVPGHSTEGPSKLGTDETVKVCSNADPEPPEANRRPRKRRRESTFSKNVRDTFEHELTKYGDESCGRGESREVVEESAESISDFELNDLLEKWTKEKEEDEKEKIVSGKVSKSTQCDVTNSSERLLPWKNTQVHFILEKAECKETYEGDWLRHCNLILEECSETRKIPETGNVSKTSVMSRNNTEVRKVWIRSKEDIFQDGLDSEDSETDCTHYPKELGFFQKDSLLCYTLCLEPEDSVPKNNYFLDETPSSGKSSEKEITINEKSLLIPKMEDNINRDEILPTETEEEQESFGEMNEYKQSDEEEEIRSAMAPKLHLKVINIETGCKDVKSDSGEQKQDWESATAPKQHPEIGKPCNISEETLSEVFVKESPIEDSLMTYDVESETGFAESEDFWETDDYQKRSCSISDRRGVHVFQIEGTLSGTHELKRLKTLEILGDGSFNDMRNISTEIVLICENISKDRVSLEEWHSNSSGLGRCLRKESENSAAYLIEIPLHFTRVVRGRKRRSERDWLYITSDSD